MSVTRRLFMITGLAGTAGLAACGAPRSGSQIDARVRESRATLFAQNPELQELASRSAGVLIIPEINKAGFVVGGAYGEGALMVGDAVVDHISVGAASFGLQIGAQSFGQALFFTTPQALADFRQADGWQLGVDAEVAVLEDGVAFGASTSTLSRPVYEVIYGQKGLIIGASLEGAKYNRLIR